MLGRLRRAKRFIEGAEREHTSAPERTSPSIAQEAFLAMLDPDRGTRRSATGARVVVPAAILLELAHEGRIGASGEGRKTRVVVHDTTPVGDEILDGTLLMLGSGLFGHKATRLIALGTSDVEVTRRLVASGELDERLEKKLGLFTVRRLYPTPAARHHDIVTRVSGALLGESVPDDRTTLLIAALDLGVLSTHVVPKHARKDVRLSRAEMRSRLSDDERALLSAADAVIERDS